MDPSVYQRELNSLRLFTRLIKDGCKWQGDILSRKWSECLYVDNEARLDDIKHTLQDYNAGEHYMIEGDIERDTHFCIWIA